jgi:hypothetical protein
MKHHIFDTFSSPNLANLAENDQTLSGQWFEQSTISMTFAVTTQAITTFSSRYQLQFMRLSSATNSNFAIFLPRFVLPSPTPRL